MTDKLASQYNFVPSFAIYEPGFLRLGAMLSKETRGCPKPIYRLRRAFSFGLY